MPNSGVDNQNKMKLNIKMMKMKNLRLSIASIVLLFGIGLEAQNVPSEGVTEVTEKNPHHAKGGANH